MLNSRPRHHAAHNASRLLHGLAMLELSAAGALSKPRLLVADDDPTTGELLSSIAGQHGYEVVSVTDGREAYRLLRSDANFQAAVFNMTMPLLKGADIVHYMKGEKRLMRIPVIALSGDQGLKVIADSFAAGAIAFLSKPFTADQLQRILRVAMSNGRPTVSPAPSKQ